MSNQIQHEKPDKKINKMFERITNRRQLQELAKKARGEDIDWAKELSTVSTGGHQFATDANFASCMQAPDIIHSTSLIDISVQK